MEMDDRELIDTDITREQAEGDTIHPLGYAAMNLILSGVAVLQLGSRQAPIAGP